MNKRGMSVVFSLCLGCVSSNEDADALPSSADFYAQSASEQAEFFRRLHRRTLDPSTCMLTSYTGSSGPDAQQYTVTFPGRDGECVGQRTITYRNDVPYWACISPVTDNVATVLSWGAYRMECGSDPDLEGPNGTISTNLVIGFASFVASAAMCGESGTGLLWAEDRYEPASRSCDTIPAAVVGVSDRYAWARSRMLDARSCGAWSGPAGRDDLAPPRARAWAAVADGCAQLMFDCQAARENPTVSASVNRCVTQR